MRMSLKVSSSRYYCPGPGLINMSPVRIVHSLTFNDMLLFLSYFEHCCIMKKTLWEKSWTAGIANMSPIPKVIIPSFSWIIWFFVVFRDTLILPRLYPPRRLSPTTPTPWGCRRCPWPHPLSASRHPSPSPV